MIQALPAGELPRHRDGLARLLQATVDAGASVGFLSPLAYDEALAFWDGVGRALAGGNRLLLCAFAGGEAVGTVQLDRVTAPNGRHRAEVMKLMVSPARRRGGVGARLMEALEDAARASGRSLLVLDTRAGDAAESLYAKLGYRRAGVIPSYALSSAGSLEATVFMYKELATPPPTAT